MTSEQELAELPRLINEIELAQPLDTFRAELFTWASLSGYPIKTLKDFMALRDRYDQSEHYDRKTILIDFDVALEVIDGLSKSRPQGFSHYETLWRFKFTSSLGSQADDFANMRALQEYFGGILLDSKLTPYLLLIPQPDGTYINIGYESILQLSHNPLGEDRAAAQVLNASYIVSQRVITESGA